MVDDRLFETRRAETWGQVPVPAPLGPGRPDPALSDAKSPDQRSGLLTELDRTGRWFD